VVVVVVSVLVSVLVSVVDGVVGLVVAVVVSAAFVVVTVGESAASATRADTVGVGSPVSVDSVCDVGSASGSGDLLDDLVVRLVSDERDGSPLRPSPTWAVGMGAVTVGVAPDEGAVALAVAEDGPDVGAEEAPPSVSACGEPESPP
jgi:MFS superfamily sulfate permease-like transporter